MKEEQLDWFSAMDKEKKVDFYFQEKADDNVFELDKNWKPIVTEEEVIAYSKENCWD